MTDPLSRNARVGATAGVNDPPRIVPGQAKPSARAIIAPDAWAPPPKFDATGHVIPQNRSRPTPAAPSPTTEAPRTPGQGGVLFIGDSHTSALALSFGEMPHAGGTVRYEHRDGSSADQWATGGSLSGRLDTALRRRPDVVVISLGTNDGISRRPDASVQANIRDIVDRARAKGAHVIVALPLRTTQHVAGINATRSAIASDLRASRPDVDVIDASAVNIPLRDGIHGTWTSSSDVRNGYGQWSSFLLQHVNPASRAALQRAGERNKR